MDRYKYYEKCFTDMKHQYIKNTGKFPTDCIVSLKIYEEFMSEIIKFNKIFLPDMVYEMEQVSCYMGIRIKKGHRYGMEEFNFYIIEE